MNKNKTQEKILKTSKKLFAEFGFNATTTAMIAESVGIKKPSIYYFFKNKESIYISLLKDTLSEASHLFINKNSKDLLWVITEIFKISKKNGGFIFSIQSLSDSSIQETYPSIITFKKNMKTHLSTFQLHCSVDEAATLIIDTSQSYARRVAQKQKVMSPKKYAELLTHLIQK